MGMSLTMEGRGHTLRHVGNYGGACFLLVALPMVCILWVMVCSLCYIVLPTLWGALPSEQNWRLYD